MVAIVGDKIAFSRDQVVTSTQAGKNFGEMRRRAKRNPLYVSDRNDGIDTVIVDFDEFESMALELDRLREELFYRVAAERVAAADSDSLHKPLSLEETLGEDAYRAFCEIEADDIPDAELFE
ncbi:MAG: hypothetical protein Q4C41_02630 [Eggerthellaceae bacterium]|nr:hypothetical protein [Eggerthellaceae bacterium]